MVTQRQHFSFHLHPPLQLSLFSTILVPFHFLFFFSPSLQALFEAAFLFIHLKNHTPPPLKARDRSTQEEVETRPRQIPRAVGGCDDNDDDDYNGGQLRVNSHSKTETEEEAIL